MPITIGIDKIFISVIVVKIVRYLLFVIIMFFQTPLSSEASRGTCIISLRDAEAIALEQNRDIQTVKQLLSKAKQGRLETASKWLPEVNLISSGYRTQNKDTNTLTRSVYITQLQLTQALFSTERFFNLRIAGLAVVQLYSLLEAIIIDVLYDVRRAYYKIVLDFEMIATAKKNIALFSELAQRELKNYKIGTAILLNVNQSQVAVANATKDYYRARRELKTDIDLLAMILGYDPGSIDLRIAEGEIPIYAVAELKEKLRRAESVIKRPGEGGAFIVDAGFPYDEERIIEGLYSEEEVDCWERIALSYLPTLRSKATGVKIAKEEVYKKKGDYLPYVNLSVNYGGMPSETTEFTTPSFGKQSFYWGVGYQINWLIWDSLGRERRIMEAVHEKCARTYEYLKEVQTTYLDVRKEIYSIEEAVANFVISDSNVLLAEQTLELAKNQFDIGYITIFDYEIVVNNLIQAMNIRNEARYGLMTGYFGLVHASGLDLMCSWR